MITDLLMRSSRQRAYMCFGSQALVCKTRLCARLISRGLCFLTSCFQAPRFRVVSGWSTFGSCPKRAASPRSRLRGRLLMGRGFPATNRPRIPSASTAPLFGRYPAYTCLPGGPRVSKFPIFPFGPIRLGTSISPRDSLNILRSAAYCRAPASIRTFAAALE